MTDGFGGRFLEVHIGGIGVAVATPTKESGVQSRTITRNRAEIDVTSDDDSGWRSLVIEPGTRSADLSLTGVMTAENYAKLLDRFQDETNPDHYSVDLFHPADSASAGMRIKESGKFFLQSLETGAEQAGAVTFSATFLSSGTVSRETVANAVDTSDTPVLRTAIAASATLVILTFDRPLEEGATGIAAAGSFTITQGNTNRSATAVDVTGNVVDLTTSGVTAVAGTVSYEVPDPSTNALRSGAGTLVPSFEDIPLVNLV